MSWATSTASQDRVDSHYDAAETRWLQTEIVRLAWQLVTIPHVVDPPGKDNSLMHALVIAADADGHSRPGSVS